jgi:hypothetical protein
MAQQETASKPKYDISIIRPEMRAEQFALRGEGFAPERLAAIRKGLRTLHTLERHARRHRDDRGQSLTGPPICLFRRGIRRHPPSSREIRQPLRPALEAIVRVGRIGACVETSRKKLQAVDATTAASGPTEIRQNMHISQAYIRQEDVHGVYNKPETPVRRIRPWAAFFAKRLDGGH